MPRRQRTLVIYFTRYIAFELFFIQKRNQLHPISASFINFFTMHKYVDFLLGSGRTEKNDLWPGKLRWFDKELGFVLHDKKLADTPGIQDAEVRKIKLAGIEFLRDYSELL